jgi:hypothetical protein
VKIDKNIAENLENCKIIVAEILKTTKNKIGRIFLVLSYTPCREDVGGKSMAALPLSFGARLVKLQHPAPAAFTVREEELPEPKR